MAKFQDILKWKNNEDQNAKKCNKRYGFSKKF